MDEATREAMDQVRRELQDYVDENVVGAMPINEISVQLFELRVRTFLAQAYNTLPECVHLHNFRIHDAAIAFDGWVIDKREEANLAADMAEAALRRTDPRVKDGIWSDADSLCAVLAILGGADRARAALLSRDENSVPRSERSRVDHRELEQALRDVRDALDAEKEPDSERGWAKADKIIGQALRTDSYAAFEERAQASGHGVDPSTGKKRP